MLTRSEAIVAVIRTAVPAFVGYVIALLITAIPAVGDAIRVLDAQIAAAGVVGVTVLGLLQAAAVAAVVALYYLAARWLGSRWPLVERFLLGSSQTPLYHADVVIQEHRDRAVVSTLTAPAASQFADLQAAAARLGIPAGEITRDLYREAGENPHQTP